MSEVENVKNLIYIIVLNYNGYIDTMECINSLQNTIPPEKVNYRIVVVDNHSTDDSYKLLNEHLPNNVDLIASNRNAGYAYGNNIGIQYAIGHGAQYICILNNDTIICEDFLSPCIKELENNHKIAFIGPMLMNYYNELVQSTGGKISIVKGKSFVLNKNVSESSILERFITCDLVYGAAMIFRSDLIKKIGLIPENYFLFYEETEWCYKAKNYGFINCINTKTKVIHKGSESLKTMSKMQEYLMERNRTLFVKRNGTLLQFLLFLIYDLGRTIYRSVFLGVPLITYIKYHYDGIIERFDPRIVNIREQL